MLSLMFAGSYQHCTTDRRDRLTVHSRSSATTEKARRPNVLRWQRGTVKWCGLVERKHSQLATL